MALALKAELAKVAGFISVERFESVTVPGKFLSLSFWQDEKSIQDWYSRTGHETHTAKVVKMFSRIIGYASPVLFATTIWPLDAHWSVSK
jgi:heme-degrading monooxygenase HmoA